MCARTGIDHAHFLAERLERALIHGAVAALAARVALEHVLNMVQTEQARHALERALVQRVPQRPPERVRPRRHRCPAPRGWSHAHPRSFGAAHAARPPAGQLELNGPRPARAQRSTAMWEYLRTVMARSYWHGAAQRYTEDLHLQLFGGPASQPPIPMHVRSKQIQGLSKLPLRGDLSIYVHVILARPPRTPLALMFSLSSHTRAAPRDLTWAPHDAYELRTAAPRGSGGHHPGLQRQTAC